MTMRASPEATASSAAFFSAVLRRPVSQAVRMPRGSSQAAIFLKCCSARISVGGERSYDGLAAADVALNEAVHGTVRGQIGEDLVRDAALGVREVEGKLRKEAADQFGVVARERRGGALKGHGARFAQRDLLGEEFVEDEPAPGGGGALLQTDDVGARGRRGCRRVLREGREGRTSS